MVRKIHQPITKKIGVGGARVSAHAKKLVNKVLASGRFSAGPMVRAFEEQFGNLVGRKFAISVSSGTSALRVAVHALKEHDNWSDGDEILVPALTFIATSNVVLQNNLKPVFVDIEPVHFQIDPRKIEEKITKRTRAIMPVHLCGQSADMIPIMRIAKQYKLRVIEDSCETVGVAYRGKPVGSRGDIACFSTYMAHLITTGVGGVATTNNAELAVRLRSLVNHGRDAIYTSIDDDAGKKGKDLFMVAERRFSFVSVGYSDRLTEFEGALGLAQIRELDKNIKHRRKIAERLTRGLGPLAHKLQLPRAMRDSEHAFMFYPLVLLDDSVMRDDLIEWLEDHFVETRYLMPLLSQPAYLKLFGDIRVHYPVATRIEERGFYVGCHPEMSVREADHIADVFHAFFRE